MNTSFGPFLFEVGLLYQLLHAELIVFHGSHIDFQIKDYISQEKILGDYTSFFQNSIKDR